MFVVFNFFLEKLNFYATHVEQLLMIFNFKYSVRFFD